MSLHESNFVHDFHFCPHSEYSKTYINNNKSVKINQIAPVG